MAKADPFFLTFLRLQHILQRAVCTSLEEQLDPLVQLPLDGDPVASRGGSVPIVLKKHIVTCEFRWGGG